jgi:hypothetical protein
MTYTKIYEVEMRELDKIYSEFRRAKIKTIKQLSCLFGISERNTHRHLKKKGYCGVTTRTGHITLCRMCPYSTDRAAASGSLAGFAFPDTAILPRLSSMRWRTPSAG